MEDYEKTENYNQVHLICTKDPSNIQRNAIESCSKSTLLKHDSAVNRSVAGDATWDAAVGAQCGRASLMAWQPGG
jgi:hypothetical protein